MYDRSGSFAEGYAIGRDTSNGGMGGNGAFGWGDSAWWIIILLIFGWNGGRGNGWGGNGSGVADNYTLATDFATIERKLDGVNNGLCDGFYAVNTAFGNLNNTLATNFAGVQNTLTQGFAGVNSGLVTQGYENRIATNAIGTQLASCCCDIKEGIQANTTQGVLNTNALQQQIQNCCCENEKMQLQTRYETAQNQCSTLQAIDKVGDRIIDYLANKEAQNLRDENTALRLAASQQAQNNYLVNALRPCPVPAYITCNPYAYQAPVQQNDCGCFQRTCCC